MGRKFSLLSLALALVSVAHPASAADRGAQAGVMFGYSVPDAPNTAPYTLFGVKGSAFIVPMFSTGGYFLTSDKQGAPSETEKFRYSLHGVEATVHLPGGSGDTFIGLRVGITKVKTNPNGVDATFSPYHYGIATGYDFSLFSFFTLGFEGSYIHVQNGKTPQNGTSIHQDSFNIMSFLVTAQFSL